MKSTKSSTGSMGALQLAAGKEYTQASSPKGVVSHSSSFDKGMYKGRGGKEYVQDSAGGASTGTPSAKFVGDRGGKEYTSMVAKRDGMCK